MVRYCSESSLGATVQWVKEDVDPELARSMNGRFEMGRNEGVRVPCRKNTTSFSCHGLIMIKYHHSPLHSSGRAP